MPGPSALSVSALRHAFGDTLALDGVDLDVDRGEIVGLVGRNGAGKTTTMRAIMGILVPAGGQVSWGGHDVDGDDRRSFGYMPEERGLYPQMRLAEQVAYFGTLHGMEPAAAQQAAGTWLERLGLASRGDDKVVALSHGNQQRAQLAVALVHSPPLLVLDEPFAGLDPEAVAVLSEIMRDCAAAGTAVLFSSHQLELVERVCRRVVILDQGRVLAAGTIGELRTRVAAHLRVQVDGDYDWATRLPGVQVQSRSEEGVLLRLDPGCDPQAVLRAAQAAAPVQHFGFEAGGLTDLYHQLLAS